MPSRTSRHGECSAKKAVVTELRWRSTPACSKQSSDCSSLRPMNKPPGIRHTSGGVDSRAYCSVKAKTVGKAQVQPPDRRILIHLAADSDGCWPRQHLLP